MTEQASIDTGTFEHALYSVSVQHGAHTAPTSLCEVVISSLSEPGWVHVSQWPTVKLMWKQPLRFHLLLHFHSLAPAILTSVSFSKYMQLIRHQAPSGTILYPGVLSSGLPIAAPSQLSLTQNMASSKLATQTVQPECFLAATPSTLACCSTLLSSEYVHWLVHSQSPRASAISQSRKSQPSLFLVSFHILCA